MLQKTLILLIALLCASISHAQLRVVNYNIAKCLGDHDALDTVIDAMSLDDSVGDAIPVSILLFQEVSQGKENVLHQFLGEKYSKGTYTNKGESGGAQAMFYNSTQLQEVEDSHTDIFTGATR